MLVDGLGCRICLSLMTIEQEHSVEKVDFCKQKLLPDFLVMMDDGF